MMEHEDFKQEIINSLESDCIKEYITTKNLKLEDGSFIKEGTHFIAEGLTDYDKYEIHFCHNEDNIYIPNEGTGDGYFFDIHEIKKLIGE